MKITHWNNQDREELLASLRNLTREGFNLRFQQANGQLANPARMRLVRRDIARIKFVLSQRRKRDLSSAAAPKAQEN